MLRIALAVALAASLQARYDGARAIVESSRDARAVAAARAEIAAVEHEDGAPKRRAFTPPPLPSSWARAYPERARDAVLESRLAAVAHTFRGTAAIWVHDLRTGRVAGWNEDVAIPAASTVKLAALAASLRAARRDLRYDEEQLAAWSSNLAANRILARLGDARVHRALAALGMTHSTYPGPYRAGTATGSPHTRVTTAHDLGRALFELQRAALGRSRFLTHAQGLRARDLLRGSLPFGDNLGLLRPWLRGVAVAEKNGWLHDARLTAAIVYRPRGPVIVVVAAVRDDLRRSEARALGHAVWRVL